MVLESFVKKNNYEIIEKIAKGWTSFIYLAKDRQGKKIVLKVLREKSNRKDMVERESENLWLANSVGVGPRFVKADFEENIVVYEYVDGVSFSDWLNSNPSQKEMLVFLKEIFFQSKKLDKIGLDHGQLAGRGKNIIVTKDSNPVIIDFEKASTKRKVGNVNQLRAFFFINPNSVVVKKIREILGNKFQEFKEFL